MNEAQNINPREQMEVRLVALLLGEASPFEEAELRAAMERDPGLAAFYKEVEGTIGLVREASKKHEASTPAAQPLPTLSPERREKLLAGFKVIKPDTLKPKKKSVSALRRVVEWGIAACLVLILSAMLLPALGKAKQKAQGSVAVAKAKQRELDLRLKQEVAMSTRGEEIAGVPAQELVPSSAPASPPVAAKPTGQPILAYNGTSSEVGSVQLNKVYLPASQSETGQSSDNLAQQETRGYETPGERLDSDQLARQSDGVLAKDFRTTNGVIAMDDVSQSSVSLNRERAGTATATDQWYGRNERESESVRGDSPAPGMGGASAANSLAGNRTGGAGNSWESGDIGKLAAAETTRGPGGMGGGFGGGGRGGRGGSVNRGEVAVSSDNDTLRIQKNPTSATPEPAAPAVMPAEAPVHRDIPKGAIASRADSAKANSPGAEAQMRFELRDAPASAAPLPPAASPPNANNSVEFYAGNAHYSAEGTSSAAPAPAPTASPAPAVAAGNYSYYSLSEAQTQPSSGPVAAEPKTAYALRDIAGKNETSSVNATRQEQIATTTVENNGRLRSTDPFTSRQTTLWQQANQSISSSTLSSSSRNANSLQDRLGGENGTEQTVTVGSLGMVKNSAGHAVKGLAQKSADANGPGTAANVAAQGSLRGFADSSFAHNAPLTTATPAPASPMTAIVLPSESSGDSPVLGGRFKEIQSSNKALGFDYKLGDGAVAVSENAKAPAPARQIAAASTIEAVDKKVSETPASPRDVRLNIATPPADAPLPRKPATNAPVPQPEVTTAENAFSTFSLNVSDVSFKTAMASLQNGQLPEPASIRVEEFVNAFNYRDPAPTPGSRLAFAWERARYPFAHNRDILRFGIQTAARGRDAQRPLNLTILFDNSGSMERPDRVAIVHAGLKALAAQLRPQDRVSVIAFARTARLVVDNVAGDRFGALLDTTLNLNPEGGTNLEDAMRLGYETALRRFAANGVNRVIMMTDGAANLGNVDPEQLKQQVESNRKKGIALDCFGIGWEGYNDDLLETLSRNGDGRYGFVNSVEDAESDFAGQLAGALNVAASDVKAQIEFNPARVTSWRQIGYAKHQLKKEQFRDNTVDAAEIAAAEQGNALYVIEINPQGTGPIGTARARFKVPETGEYVEQEWALEYNPQAPALEQAGPAMRLAVCAAAFGEWLSASPFAAEVNPGALAPLLSGVPETFSPDPRPRQLVNMINAARAASGK